MDKFKCVTVLMFLFELFLFGDAYSSVIIVEDAKACYRRVLAGKRVLGRVVLRVVPCERLEDCQRECSDERRFDCETFNYRLDPSNRGKGLCELTSTPVAHLDLRKDFIEDRDYDFYELDRNSAPDCSLSWPHWLEQSGVSGCPGCQGSSYSGRPGFSHRHEEYDKRWDNRGWVAYGSENRYGSNADSYRGHHGDFFHLKDWDRDRGKLRPINFDRRWDRNFVPYEITGGRRDQKHWGQYGGSYGHGESHRHNYNDHKSSYDYWGLNRPDYDKHYLPNNSIYPSRGVYHSGDYYGDKNKHDFNYFDLGHRNQGTKCCGGKDDYWGTYGSYGHSSHNSHSSSSHEYEEHGHYGSGPPGHYGSGPSGHYRPEPPGHYGSGPGHFAPADDNWIGIHGSPNRPYDCSSRSGSGFRMSRGVVRKGFSVPDIYECERICFAEKHFRCNSYSFRYSNSPSDNCFLSDRPYPMLDLYNDVQPDRDFDIYAMNDDRKYCEHFIDDIRPGGPPRYPDDRMESECFWRVRSGRKLSSGAVKVALVATGIAHCEAECLRAQDFTCRAFSFRYGPPVIGDILENCQLTDWPQVGRSHEGLVESPPCELYERGSYGHGCELNPFALDSPNALGPVREPKKDELCYLQYDTSAKLLPEAVRIGVRLPTEHACKVHCTKLRENARGRSIAPDDSSFKCMSFSYTSDPHLPPHKDNCLLTDIQLRDLQPSLDYTHSKTHWLFAYNTFDPACTFGEVPRPGGFPGGFPPGRPSGPGPRPPYPPSSTDLEPPGYLSERPGRPSGPSGPSGPGPRPSGHGEYAGLFGRPSDHGWNRRFDEDTWSVFTVSGWPCRRGTKCAPNAIAGYWSCELEGGEIGSWDYCCHPGHRCGHSKGFNYPWCYVGPSRSQWRPCSDRYYPYGNPSSSSSGYLSGGDRNDLPGRPHHGGRPYLPQGNRRYWQDIYRDGPSSYYDEHNNPRPGYVRVPTIEKNRIKFQHNYGPERPSRPHWIPVRAPNRPEDNSGPEFLEPPRPGGFGAGRYWPVSYLHKEAPPNSTFYKSDKERGRNNIPQVDKRRFPEDSGNRRNGDSNFRFNTDRRPEENKPNTDRNGNNGSNRNSDNNNGNNNNGDNNGNVNNNGNGNRNNGNGDNNRNGGNGGTQVLSIDSRNGRDQDNNVTKNVTSNDDDDKLILISTSNTTDEAKDKKSRIVKGPSKSDDDLFLNTGERVDDKVDRFTDDNVEVFTVDEPLRGKLSETEAKANLERLLKEEKQIEEIGKAFKRRDERTRVPVEKRSQNEYNPNNDFSNSFQPIFIPVDLETRSERTMNFDGSNRRGRTFSGNKDYSTDKPQSVNNSIINQPFRDSNIRPNFDSSTDHKTVYVSDQKHTKSTNDKSDSDAEDSIVHRTEKGIGKSVISNGQVFYEVLPDEIDNRRLLGHIEKVELKNYGVNINPVKPKSDTDQIRSATGDFRRPSYHEEYDMEKTTVSSDEYELSGIENGQFGVRTGQVKRVEVPFHRSNNTSGKLISRGRRNFRMSYDPSVVRKRLLERQKAMSSESSKEI